MTRVTGIAKRRPLYLLLVGHRHGRGGFLAWPAVVPPAVIAAALLGAAAITLAAASPFGT